MVDCEFRGLTTTAIPPCATAAAVQHSRAIEIKRDRVNLVRFIVLSRSECENQLHLQSIQIRLTFSHRVIELRLEPNRFREVVAGAERRAMAQQNVIVINAVPICIHVLVAEEWAELAESLGNLKRERRHVVDRSALFIGIPYTEGFVQELDSMAVVNHVAIHDHLTEADVGTQLEIADAVVIKRSANLEPRNRPWPRNQADIDVVPIVLVSLTVPLRFGRIESPEPYSNR